MKTHDIDPKDSGAENPYRNLLYKLAGLNIKKPRAKSAINLWRRTQRDDIEAEVRQRLQQSAAAAGEFPSKAEQKNMISLREKVAKEFFDNLSAEVKATWAEAAQEEHDAALSKWKEDLEACPSTLPADRQRFVLSFPRLICF